VAAGWTTSTGTTTIGTITAGPVSSVAIPPSLLVLTLLFRRKLPRRYPAAHCRLEANREALRNTLLRKALSCRGDWTPVKLFLQGAASIPPAIQRLILAFVPKSPLPPGEG